MPEIQTSFLRPSPMSLIGEGEDTSGVDIECFICPVRTSEVSKGTNYVAIFRKGKDLQIPSNRTANLDLFVPCSLSN